MSDDLSMQALSGSLAERAEAAFAAGCDVALHCNGKMEEMAAVAAGGAEPRGRGPPAGARRRSRRIRHEPEPFDPVDARARLDAALALAA